jgi:hypothetical protein
MVTKGILAERDVNVAPTLKKRESLSRWIQQYGIFLVPNADLSRVQELSTGSLPEVIYIPFSSRSKHSHSPSNS